MGDDERILFRLRPLMDFVASVKYDVDVRKKICGCWVRFDNIEWANVLKLRFGTEFERQLSAFESFIRLPYLGRKWVI